MPGTRGLYEVSREKMRTRHFAYRTEQAYLYWIRRYVNFHNRKHPREMGSIFGAADSPPYARESHAACSAIGGPKGGHHSAGELSYLPTLRGILCSCYSF